MILLDTSFCFFFLISYITDQDVAAMLSIVLYLDFTYLMHFLTSDVALLFIFSNMYDFCLKHLIVIGNKKNLTCNEIA